MRLPNGAEAGDARTIVQHEMAHIERHLGDRDAALEHDIGGFRIDIDVELGGRGGVAAFEIGRRPSCTIWRRVRHDLPAP